MFDVPEDGFRFGTTELAQSNALLRKQVIPSLLAVALEFETDLDAAIALGLRAFGFERAGGAIQTFVETALGEIPVFGFVWFGFHVEHALLRRADKLVLFLIVGEVGRLETQLLQSFGLAGQMLLLVDGVVLEEVAHAFLL